MLREKLDQYLDTLLVQGKIPGCGLIVRQGGDVIYKSCKGLRDIEADAPAEEDTVFRMASMTKLIIAVAVMKLAEEKKLSLNDNLVRFFPDYPEEKKRVRIRHLLNHSSSLGQTPKSMDYFWKVLDLKEDLKSRTDKWAWMPFDCELAETADYSAFVNFDLLGRIIEVTSDMPLDDYLKENILLPLKMEDTGFFLTDEQMSRLAACYNYTDGKLVREGEHTLLLDASTTEYGYCSGSAGIFSTLHDYDRFTLMLAQGGALEGVRILSEESLRLMRTPRQLSDVEWVPGCPWGLGFMIFEEPEKADICVAPGTYGWSGAYGTHMFIHEPSGICATFVICMGDLNGAESYISREIERIVFREVQKQER